MKFTRLIIRNFAQIEHLDVSLRTDTPNLIIGPNETGKSHIVTALYGIVFGLDHPERYLPWDDQAATPQGILEFVTQAGQVVRLERMFISQEVTVSVEREEPWTEIAGPATPMAEAERYYACLQQWFGFTEAEIFTATTFVRQTDLAGANLTGAAPQIKALITGSHQGDYERALEEMRKELALLRAPAESRTPRLLEQKEHELAELEEQHREAQRRLDRIGRLQERQIRVNGEIAAAEADRRMLDEQRERVTLLIEREREMLGLQDEYRQAQAQLDKFVLAHERMEQAGAERSKYSAAEGTDVVVLLQLEHTVRQAEQRLAAAEERISAQSGWSGWVPWVIVLIGVAAGLSLAFLLHSQLLTLDHQLKGIVLSPLGIGMGIVILVFLLLAWGFGLWKDVPRPETDEVRAAREELAAAETARAHMFEALGVSTVEETITMRRTFEGADRGLDRAKAGLEALGDESEASARAESVRARLDAVQSIVDQMLENDVTMRALGSPDKRVEFEAELQHRGTALHEQLRGLRAEQAAIERELLTEEGTEHDIPVLYDQILGVRREIRLLQRRADALMLAIKALELAAAEFHEHVLDPVIEEASLLMRDLTDGRYTAVHLDDETLEPTVDMPGQGGLAADLLSRGVQDQLYFALRVALGSALAGGRALPLVLDDPYINLDAARLSRTILLLRSLSRRSQILLFSCNVQYEQWFEPVVRLHRWRTTTSPAEVSASSGEAAS